MASIARKPRLAGTLTSTIASDERDHGYAPTTVATVAIDRGLASGKLDIVELSLRDVARLAAEATAILARRVALVGALGATRS